MVDCPDLHVRDNQTINCNNLDFNAKKVSISDASSMMFSPQISGVQHVHLSWWFLWNISAERSPGRDDGSDPRDRAGWADAWRSHHVYINPPKIAIFTVVSGVCFIYWRCGFQSTSRNGGSQKDVGYLGPHGLPGRCKMPPPSCRVHDSSSTSEWKVSWQSWAFEQRPRENKITVKIGVVKIGQNYQVFFFNEGFPADVPQSCAAFVSLAWLSRKIEVALLLVFLQSDQFGWFCNPRLFDDIW